MAFNFLGQFPLKVVAWEARQSLENTREMFSHFLHFLKPNPGYLFPYQMETCKAWMGTVTQCIVCVPADCLPRCSVHTSPCPALLLPGRRQLLARLGSSTQAFFPRMPVPLPLLGMTLKKKIHRRAALLSSDSPGICNLSGLTSSGETHRHYSNPDL